MFNVLFRKPCLGDFVSLASLTFIRDGISQQTSYFSDF